MPKPVPSISVPPAAAPRWTFAPAPTPDALRAQEWLLTNGLGGFAMGTASGIPTRRYHALLIGATRPPVGRIAALNALVERIEDGPQFTSFEFTGPQPVTHPDGLGHLQGFEAGDSVKWQYAAEGFALTRECVLYAGVNALGIRYRLARTRPGEAVTFSARPLVSLRDFHELIHRAHADNIRTALTGSGVELERDGHAFWIESRGDHAAFRPDHQWWHNFFYREDAARGQSSTEDLFCPGVFEAKLPRDRNELTIDLVAWMGNRAARPEASIDDELAARQARRLGHTARLELSRLPPADREPAAILARAADDFIVARRDAAGALTGVSTIAGYPWFSDWGRDTFISLPGLLIATGRIDDAARELQSFASARRNGIIPNVFNDQTGEAEYNTVDASLWFILAACRWLEAGGDTRAFDAHFLDACLDVVESYRRGTDFNIAMDPVDMLISAGTSATQLTWMDARRDGVTFTPRHGKPVEINALWHCALRTLASALAGRRGTLAADLGDLAASVGRGFAAKFWNPRRNCLFDCLTPGDTGWTADESIRPNQVFAVSLPCSPLSTAQQRAVVECVRARLVTPLGIRTLDPADPRYKPRYRGTLFERDGAYHQGTAWPWLLGPVAEAVLRSGDFSAQARADARTLLDPLLKQLTPGACAPRPGACAGHIAEIYDGSGDAHEPQRAGGCPAQAWSVAEFLRVLLLINRPPEAQAR